MIGVMTSSSRTIVQLVLPFEGLRDRVRNAADTGQVLFTGQGKKMMQRDGITDVIMIRALKRCELLGRAQQGVSRGEWRCVVSFNYKGFRQGGSVELTFSEGRVFVENTYWDCQP